MRMLKKKNQKKEKIEKEKLNLDIEVDGGVNEKNAKKIIRIYRR